ncbi:MAG: DUF1292 domain-containing protein [Acidibacillus sp.]|uniref:Uncharacterized protein n=1 Tax=Sulfoacidibacillus ferrooxidans TaxID=2005001 RepID=A0A9X1V5W9_9BACL|nr:DUF1292 domain-containing protein [Sulfoacidibacillus ferrooxidans]MCI0181923.1 hypothetical protein [Sulfoacidibacillus ferrooxidans]MCY0892781.1 DUF1292 domain-containing protein [Acidibacillus sp.]
MMDELLQGRVELVDDEGNEEPYRVLRVMEMNERHYVVLQSEVDKKEEPLILRVEGNIETDNITFSGIEDDEEWENVAEAFDTILFELDDQS